ncbi:MAG: hypothetical protein Q9223_001525 [Gallowayella weberi]
MAQVQSLKRKQKTNAVKTAEPGHVQQQQAQQQSFEMAYTTLHSSLNLSTSGSPRRDLFYSPAVLTWSSHLFPDECFEDSHLDAIRTHAEAHYHHRTENTHGRKRHTGRAGIRPSAPSHQVLKVFVQNPSHPGVKIFLRWLDGILEGILEQTVTAAQFGICLDPTNAANVIESYTFRFHYQENEDRGCNQFTKLAVSGSFTGTISMVDAPQGLNELINRIASYAKKMPDLPGLPMILGTPQSQQADPIF